MSLRPNAVELTVEQAWYIAETGGAGSFPWVLAITTPYRDAGERAAFLDGQAAELAEMGLMSPQGDINPAVAEWIRVVCFPERWLDLRFIGPSSSPDDLLRGIVARRGQQTVVALRNAQLVTFTAMDINDPRELGPVLTAGLSGRAPAHFEEFRLPARVGARADERLRGGAPLTEVLEYLGIPRSARSVVESVFTGPRSYVEIVAGQRSNGRHATTEVGMSVVDTEAGRVLVSPSRAFDDEWVSTFTPGTPLAIATAVDHLTELLPDGRWFPDARLLRDFTAQHI
ncbi:ESX secretion-associated protein EspG [Mycolicibacillus parakoreensis]|uniref:ESX secretion-associated protein EspG n=1 Tax=Mycolicibacillus parakoreensis TaxID=1069221 RepID=A0ABY3TXZ4_9MYCO|nr:ESX secretion-associated protein EspG [Mycolicibacillus parakoreensis]MCV7316348.1 ESX secretion-associated protein EspG [Mycolicibacillus parakoreensis]ULN52593.1 ESX secretion-associated protein EspG [Mycolicibacillus parakoreensis]